MWAPWYSPHLPAAQQLAGGVPAQDLTGSTFTKALTFPTGTIAPGAVTLSGAVFTRAPTFPTGAVSQPGGEPQDLTGAAFQKAPTFPSGTLSATYALTGAVFTKAPSFIIGTLSTTYALSGAVFTKSPTFPTGTIAHAGADPPDFQVVISGNTAQLSWTASPTQGVADYSIFRRSPQTGAPFDPDVDTPVYTGVTGTSKDDTNLPAGEYDWQVFGRIP